MKKLAFLGDSITAVANWNTLLNRTDCINLGVSGDTTAQMLARVSDVYTSGADICFIMGGKNDAETETTAAQIGHNLIDTAGAIRGMSGILPVIIAPFKVGVAQLNYVNLNIKLSAVGAYLGSPDTGAPANIVDFMDLNTIWMAPNAVLKSEYTFDGTHLTAAGYAQWAFLLNYWLNQHGY